MQKDNLLTIVTIWALAMISIFLFIGAISSASSSQINYVQPRYQVIGVNSVDSSMIYVYEYKTNTVHIIQANSEYHIIFGLKQNGNDETGKEILKELNKTIE